MEMLDDIVSADPRASQGIGGDNMTIMIVDLLTMFVNYIWQLQFLSYPDTPKDTRQLMSDPCFYQLM